MVEAEGIPPTASVASVGPGIRYVGNWTYAFSGTVDVGGVQSQEYTLLDFTSGVGVIKAICQFYYVENQSEDYSYRIKFNGEAVAVFIADSPSITNPWLTELLIPPETRVVFTAANLSNANVRQQAATLTGRVYDV